MQTPYCLIACVMAIAPLAISGHGAGQPPGEEMPLVGATPAERDSGSFNLVWTIVGSLPSGQQQQISAILFRVENRMEALFANENPVTCRLEFEWSLTALPTALAQSPHIVDPFTFTFVRDKLLALAQEQEESSQEIGMYGGFPQGFFIPVIFTTTHVNHETIGVPKSLQDLKWVPKAGTTVGKVLVDGTEAWDFLPLNGINAQSIDLEETVMHEICHILGFESALEETADDRIMVWDMFRFNDAIASNGVDPDEFLNSSRELRPGQEAIGATLLSAASWVYRLSTGQPGGDNRQASHWKDDALTGIHIGVMDPTASTGQTAFQAGYLSAADRRALDIIGWNLAIPGPPPAGAGQQQQPPNGQQRSSLAPLLEWDTGFAAETTNVYIFEGLVPSDSTQVYVAEGLTATAQQVPYGVLDESTTYSWITTSINVIGFAYSPVWSFTTRCYADCNADGALTIADFGCFQTQFGNGDPEADCNESGTLTIADFGCFQTRFEAGCP